MQARRDRLPNTLLTSTSTQATNVTLKNSGKVVLIKRYLNNFCISSNPKNTFTVLHFL